MSDIPNLWGDVFSAPLATPPAAVLKKQGQFLSAKTHNFLMGEVETTPLGNVLQHHFRISAPVLSYKMPLLTVEHEATKIYPARVSFSGSSALNRAVKDEQELLSTLGLIFSHNYTREAINSLLSQSKAL